MHRIALSLGINSEPFNKLWMGQAVASELANTLHELLLAHGS